MAHGATWMAGRHNGRVLVRHMVISAGSRCDHGKPAVESDYIRLELCFPCWNLGLGEHRRGTSPWLCAGFHRISSHIYFITYNIARREATIIWVTGTSDYSAFGASRKECCWRKRDMCADPQGLKATYGFYMIVPYFTMKYFNKNAKIPQ